VKAVILCGGRGTRLAEQTDVRPKPMVEIGGQPILLHIMNIYAANGVSEFLLAVGYKGDVIKQYFLHYHTLSANLTVSLADGRVHTHDHAGRDWNVQLVDTGLDTMTGGRLHRLRTMLDDTFMLTYGDGVSNVDLKAVIAFHRSHGRLATLTAVRPPARFGALRFDGDKVTEFREKPQADEGWINGGFFIFEPGVFRYLEGDATILEREPLERLAADGELMAYRHDGFWQCMDTVRDRITLEDLWQSGQAPWRVWRD
jgi:glucose-1-phosphate cytidylyltransferase